MANRAVGLLAAMLLGGCATTMAPPLEVPAVPVGETWRHGAAWNVATPSDDRPRGEWWRDFDDATLDRLIGMIDADTPTIAASIARLDRAQAATGRERAGLLPSVGADVAISRERISGGRPVGPGVPITTGQYLLGGSLQYELDLFGRLCGSIDAAEADAAAQAADLASVLLSLRARTVDAYLELRGLDMEAALLERTVAAYARSDDLVQALYRGGIASGIDIARSEAQLASAEARLDAISRRRAALEAAIAALIGQSPSHFTIPPDASLPALPAIARTLPSELLQRRPDISRAQRRLASANAEIGVARAALYPRLDLALSGGLLATDPQIFDASNLFWSLGPLRALAPLFDGGRRRADLRISEAEFREQAADYRQTVLDAFAEVETALAARTSLASQERDLARAAAAAARAEELSFARYRLGGADYLDVVTAQTAALTAEEAYLAVQIAQRREALTLIRALGGGHSETSELSILKKGAER